MGGPALPDGGKGLQILQFCQIKWNQIQLLNHVIIGHLLHSTKIDLFI